MMKNNYSLAERNRIVEEYLPYVDQVIRRNRGLMRAARLEYDDVYQQLSLRLIRAVSTYDPTRANWARISGRNCALNYSTARPPAACTA